MFFHTNNFAIHDPIFSCRLWDDTPGIYLKIVLCNFCFLAVCACVAAVSKLLFSCPDREILQGVGFGAFCMVWPVIYTYRLYAFWKNPAALICLFHNVMDKVAFIVSLILLAFLLILEKRTETD